MYLETFLKKYKDEIPFVFLETGFVTESYFRVTLLCDNNEKYHIYKDDWMSIKPTETRIVVDSKEDSKKEEILDILKELNYIPMPTSIKNGENVYIKTNDIKDLDCDMYLPSYICLKHKSCTDHIYIKRECFDSLLTLYKNGLTCLDKIIMENL